MSKKLKIFDSDALNNIHKRVFLFIIIFSIIYSVIFFRITDIMIFKKTLQFTKNKELIYERGKIFDRKGILLASSIKTYSLGANPQEIQDSNCNYTISLKLSEILSISKDKINRKLLRNKKHVWIKRNISPQEHQEIINLGKRGLITSVENKRIYTKGEITSHVVGYTNIDGIGQGGIEKGLESRLAKGKDIHLSIDSILQESIRYELINTIKKYSAHSGLAIVLDIKSGEILSMNSYPDFNPNNNKTFGSDNLFNRTIQGNYEMGSAFKPITAAIGIEKKVINSDMLFDVSKPIKFGRYIIKDFHPYKGKLDLKGIIVKSSNIGTAKIASKIGKKTQQEFFKKLGFYNKIGLEIDETAMPSANPNNWGELETMTIGYGHGFAITPLHLSKAYASIVNGGYKVRPTLLLKNENPLFSESVINPTTSKLVRQLLRAVVLETKYTGPRIKINGYEIGGKTGTAELLDQSGKYKKDANRTTFVSVFPMSNPEYVVLAIIDDPQKIKDENYSNTAATVVAPLVKNIILNMIKILNLPPYLQSDFLKASIDKFALENKNVTF